jgi:VanZ family protein
LKYQLPAFVWCLGIFLLSAIPRVPAVLTPFQVDKIAHAVIYGVLCFLVWRAFFFQSHSIFLRRHALMASVLFSCVYGVLDEIHQLYVPGRSSDPFDVVADGTGALVCVALLVWRTRRAKGFDKG